jgi:hypothetical protein
MIKDRITLGEEHHGAYEVTHDNGQSLLVQHDGDFPGLAQTFGWRGRVTRRHLLACKGDQWGAEIYAAQEYLDSHWGKRVANPGYTFGEEEEEE